MFDFYSSSRVFTSSLRFWCNLKFDSRKVSLLDRVAFTFGLLVGRVACKRLFAFFMFETGRRFLDESSELDRSHRLLIN